ncbi:MAG: CARDB domain-containing protein [Candidatus Hodarchaeales archaeon]
MSFVNELFERLRKSTTANDVQEAITALNNIQNIEERKKASHETLTLLQRFANELIERGQYKNAAYQYFSGSQIIHNFLSDVKIENEWLRSSADALAKASEEHIQWDDLLGGAACMTISSLLRIQTGDWNVNQHLDSFVKSHDFSSNQAAAACLYIPYDLVGAINPSNPNPSLLQRASNYTESYLLTTKPASMFYDGIKRAIEIAQQKLMQYVKFPKIRAIYGFNYDIIFGEEFKFTVKVENSGEGVASNVTVKISIPQLLRVVSGENTLTLQELNPGEQIQAEFSLICPSGEGKDEVTVEVPVNVEYQDILTNKNSISLGSASIIIRAEKKGEKLKNNLESLTSQLIENLSFGEEMKDQDILNISSSFKNVVTKIKSTVLAEIEKGKFSAAEFGIEQVEKMSEFIDPLISFTQNYTTNMKRIDSVISEIKDSTSELLETIKVIDEQLS